MGHKKRLFAVYIAFLGTFFPPSIIGRKAALKVLIIFATLFS